MSEFGLISKYFAPLAKGSASALSLKDDAAIFNSRQGYDLVLTKDAMASGTHFFKSDSPADIAWKLVSVNVSDLAAMGGTPKAYMLALILPKSTDEAWLAEFTSGLSDAINIYGGALIGGDTTSHDGELALSLTAIGEVESGKTLKRSGAKIGDDIYVSGMVGGGYLGLQMLKGELSKSDDLIARYLRPVARLELGQNLIGVANSCVDVSDGLIADLMHICDCSNVGAQINIGAIPIPENSTQLLEDLIIGGDDYELLFTCKPNDSDKIYEISQKLSLPITRIGTIDNSGKLKIHDRNGKEIVMNKKGYTHF